MQSQDQQKIEAYQTLISKAWEDPSFKQELINSPREVIRDTVNIGFEDHVKVVVTDQSAEDHVYINIPRKVELDEMELTDEQLEQVAGGDGITLGAVLLYGAATITVGFIVGVIAAEATEENCEE